MLHYEIFQIVKKTTMFRVTLTLRKCYSVQVLSFPLAFCSLLAPHLLNESLLTKIRLYHPSLFTPIHHLYQPYRTCLYLRFFTALTKIISPFSQVQCYPVCVHSQLPNILLNYGHLCNNLLLISQSPLLNSMTFKDIDYAFF